MSLILRAKPAASIPLSSSSFSAAPGTGFRCRPPPRCSSSSSPKLSAAVQFDPLLRSGSGSDSDSDPWQQTTLEGEESDDDEEEIKGGRKAIPGIHVPRQRYIAVSKPALLDALLSLFPSQPAADAADFKRFARCLDALLHAEHKEMLEEMRTYYMLTHHRDDGSLATDEQDQSQAQPLLNGNTSAAAAFLGGFTDNGTLLFTRSLGLRTLLGLSPDPDSNNRVAFATHFQRSFMKLLRNAQFEELSAQDLLLTYALNNDYLLTLPIYVDWKKAAQSNAIIFRRGYATERQKGLLLVEKLDYLQSKLLQNVFFGLSKPLRKLGKWLNEALKRSTGNEGFQIWIEKLKVWLKEQTYAENSILLIENSSWDKLRSDKLPDADVPIWIAAQRAVSRYEGILSPVGPRGRLLRRLLTWTGLIPSLPEETIKSDKIDTKDLEGYVRPNFLPRITLANIWEPASRESCNNNLWEITKASFRILFGKSTLQEPAFQELILLYTDEADQSKESEKSDMMPLQLKIFERIPIPDLPVRLDIATVIGLLAYVVNYKFESFASSPSAFLLDIVAFTALAILVFRVALGYKQTRDRYQLLVNKTLYEKTLASGFGSVYFLLDASEQQQVSSRVSIRDSCEQFMYEKFKAKIEMPIDKAMETLLRLGLVIELPTDGGSHVIALPCSDAYEILKSRWDSLLEHKTEQQGLMAKEQSGSPKARQPEFQRMRVTLTIGVIGLCVVSYIFGAWQGTSTSIQPSIVYTKTQCGDSVLRTSSNSSGQSSGPHLDFQAHHQVSFNESSLAAEKIPPCQLKYSEYTPCQDPRRARKFPKAMMQYRERHCPWKEELFRCLIPAPPKYKNPFKWPQSRDYAWYDNIPHRELSIEKAVQNWIQVEGERFKFPGGGTMFPHGADAYIDDINALISFTDGNIRTALDTGCGVASWGAYLIKRNIITMSFAPRDSHEAQVQFALERGVPAMIGVMSTERIPYPARAFDMAHCSRCLIPWNKLDGIYLIEVDRVLRPGGYWILSGPPIHWKRHFKGWERTEEDLKQEQDEIEDLAKRLCWKKVVEKDDLAIWQKPINHIECVNSRKIYETPQICKSNDVDSAWYKKMETCISPLPDANSEDEIAGGALEKWPKRAFAVPPRISRGSVSGLTTEKFQEDNKLWAERVDHYKKLIPPLTKGRYRNVMDMNAGIGGFSAALMKYPLWVMNVVPSGSAQDTLGVIYERGFIGTYHDWCEAFSTYPRTYDLIHADKIFSFYQDRCDITYILLEMDRILRPEGTVIFRDTVEVLVKIQSIADGMRWKSRIMDHESGPYNNEKILVAVKTYWTGEPTQKQ
uniref:Methyltransferase n=1 Tax=Leersia perrieri TaxID=77586 RepID=A0A0D9WKT6_9ORYZ